MREQQARGVVAVDYNQFDKAYWHFMAAALLKPPVPNVVDGAIMAYRDAIRLDPNTAALRLGLESFAIFPSHSAATFPGHFPRRR